MCIKHPEVRKWLTSKEFSEKVVSIIVDEAHCVSEWGGDFRPIYAQVSKLRSFIPTTIPMLLTSATLPPETITDLQKRFEMDPKETFRLNLGNRRPNIHKSVRFMDSAKDFKALHKLLPDPRKVKTSKDLEKTLIFTNDVLTTHKICRHLRQRYGRIFNRQIDYLH